MSEELLRELIEAVKGLARGPASGQPAIAATLMVQDQATGEPAPLALDSQSGGIPFRAMAGPPLKIITSGLLGATETVIFTAGRDYTDCVIYCVNNSGADADLTVYYRKGGATASLAQALANEDTYPASGWIAWSGFEVSNGDIISGLSSVADAMTMFVLGRSRK